MNRAEFAVVGLGSSGSYALKHLAEAGHTVVGFEAGGVANDKSAVGGDTRLFRRLYLEGLIYHQLLERAREIWLETAAVIPDAFNQCGALNIVADGSPEAEALADYGRTFDIAHEALGTEDLFARFPQFRPTAGLVGYLDPAGGYLRTDLVVQHAVAKAVDASAQVIDALVTAVTPTKAGVVVSTEHGDWQVDRVIVAAGARTPLLLPQLNPHVEPRRLMMTWFQAESPARFSPENFPVFTCNYPDLHLYGAPALDGRHVKAAGFIESRATEFTDGFDYDGTVPRAELTECAARIGEVLTGVHPTPIRAAAYPDLYTSDRDFILDYVDPEQRIFAATGFSGKGFKMCSSLGEHAAQVISGEAGILPDFSLSRFAV